MKECPNHEGSFDCPIFCPICGGEQYYTEKAFTVTTWADGSGIWHAKADFTNSLGNTGEAERILGNALHALRRAIRKEITDRAATWDNPQPLKRVRLRYEVTDNKFAYGSGCLSSLTLRERSGK